MKAVPHLVDAATKTLHIELTPGPFIMQTRLDDFYVAYQINAYTTHADKRRGSTTAGWKISRMSVKDIYTIEFLIYVDHRIFAGQPWDQAKSDLGYTVL